MAKSVFEKELGIEELKKRYGVGENNLLFILKGRNNLIMRPTAVIFVKGRKVELRYSKIFETPIVADQTTNTSSVPMDAIVWGNGKISVPASDPCLQLYLLIKLFNEPSASSIYEVYDRRKKVEEESAIYRKRSEASLIVSKATDDELKDIATYLFPNSKYKQETLRDEVMIDFFKLIERNPQKVIDVFKDETRNIRSMVALCLKSGIITNKDGDYKWKSTGQSIFVAPPTKDKVESFVRFLRTAEGAVAHEQIEKEVADLR